MPGQDLNRPAVRSFLSRRAWEQVRLQQAADVVGDEQVRISLRIQKADARDREFGAQLRLHRAGRVDGPLPAVHEALRGLDRQGPVALDAEGVQPRFGDEETLIIEGLDAGALKEGLHPCLVGRAVILGPLGLPGLLQEWPALPRIARLGLAAGASGHERHQEGEPQPRRPAGPGGTEGGAPPAGVAGRARGDFSIIQHPLVLATPLAPVNRDCWKGQPRQRQFMTRVEAQGIPGGGHRMRCVGRTEPGRRP